jgi:hypothetical protein
MEFKDVMEWVTAMVDHPHLILPNESVKNKISFISEDGETFSISKVDLKNSIKNYPPNRESIILAEKAFKGDKDPLAEFVNTEPPEEDGEYEDEDEEFEDEEEIDENEYALSSVEKLIENVDPIDKYTKDLLVRMSLMSPTALGEWRNKSIYGRLLIAVLNDEGPKGEWLKIVLDNLK